MRVFKYEIPMGNQSSVRLPVGAGILSVGQQNDKLFLWALVDPKQAKTEERTFSIAGTGHEIENMEECSFVGTVHLCQGALVLHIFEQD